ncbi:acyltransferase [Candidatus Pseudothioglobus singularis]|nr:acyltransferase [Candidatus Pseudothioglobus singularis]
MNKSFLNTSKQNNCFDEVRFILAFIVLMAHTSALGNTDRLQWLTHFFDANVAVKGFFAISGYLVTKSFYSSKTTLQYFEKRIRRIYPAYIGVIMYCLIIGAFLTQDTFFEFITNADTYRYIFSNLSLLNFIQPSLPGVFVENKMNIMNGSLWTIKVEIMLYFVVPILCYLYSHIGKKLTYFLALGFGIFWFIYFSEFSTISIAKQLSWQFPGQLPYFALGSLLGFFTIKKFSTIIILLISFIYYIFLRNELDEIYIELINMIIIPLFIITIANIKSLSIGIGRYGDLSYGLYLFHFPTIQILEHFDLYSAYPYLSLLTSIVLTLGLAFFSWHFIEKIVLKNSSHYIKATSALIKN